MDVPGRQALYERMRATLADVVPDVELRAQSELAWEILRLKAERKAIVLAHNYMEPALFASIPDFTGDSLDLCHKAQATGADVIVFCGVRFMAESAKILNPGKTVLLPDAEAGCSLADGITAADVRRLRERYPGVPVVAYINTSADVKAEADICCTSSNAADIVTSLGEGPVVFVPDEYLAHNVAVETGREIRFASRNGEEEEPPGDRTLIAWRARCEVHERFAPQDVLDTRQQFPDVAILAHPECSPEVVALCDFSGGTQAMARWIRETTAPRYLLLTECAMGDNIAAINPDKTMLRLCSVRCPHMNRITLERTLRALRESREMIEVDETVRSRAARALDRMLAFGRMTAPGG